MADLEEDKVVYEKHKKLSQTKTSVWNHFLKATDNLSAKCISCNKILKTSGGSTSGLHTHLKAAHSIILKDSSSAGIQRATTSTATDAASSFSVASATEHEPPRKKSKLTDYFPSSNSLADTVSRMTALDGLPFSHFVTSLDQKRIMAQCGYKMPTSSNSIKNMVLKHSETVKLSLITKLRKLKADGVKLSLTLDEWTSLGNRRFMNVNIHSPMLTNNFANLGLVRVFGSMPARTCLQLLENRLSAFELSLNEDIVCTTTDGASVMIAFGRKAALFHQQCLAHGIQLAILDVLYKKENSSQTQLSELEDDDSYESASECYGEDYYGEGFHLTVRAQRPNQGNEFIFKELIEKVRKVAKLFRKSPTKNDAILQKYVKQEIGHELSLILDCKTRWNSLADMLERFVKLKIPIQKALIDLNKDLEISENEFKKLVDLSNVFEILKATVEELCKRNANLMTSDAALMFMLKKLEAMHHEPVARELLQTLKRRIKERRLLVASTLNYLHDPKSYFDSSDDDYSDIFLRPDGDEMRKHIADLHQLGQTQATERTIDVSVSTTDEENTLRNDESNTLPLKKQLEMAVQKKLRTPDNVSKNTPGDIDHLDTLINIEMALYENGGSRGKYLELAYHNLRCIPPTSVESERAFSSAGYFCNHLRSRLSDQTLDALLFLRSHYLNERLTESRS